MRTLHHSSFHQTLHRHLTASIRGFERASMGASVQGSFRGTLQGKNMALFSAQEPQKCSGIFRKPDERGSEWLSEVELKGEMSLIIKNRIRKPGISFQNDIHPLAVSLSAPKGQKQAHAVSNQRVEFSVSRGERARSQQERSLLFIGSPPDEGEFLAERI